MIAFFPNDSPIAVLWVGLFCGAVYLLTVLTIGLRALVPVLDYIWHPRVRSRGNRIVRLLVDR
jgi:hypothetical protein